MYLFLFVENEVGENIMAVDSVLKYMATNEIRWVDLQFFDVTGKMNKVTVSSKIIEEASFTKGIHGADLSPALGGTEAGELVLLPDPDTAARLPWEVSTIRLLCDVIVATTNERYLKDSRYVSERIETNLKALGVKEARIGSTAEFYIFDTVTVDRTTEGRGSGTLIDSREAYWGPSALSSEKNGAYLAQPFDSMYPARIQVGESMEEGFGYTVEKHFHGRSPTSQQGVTLRAYPLQTAADAVQTLKFVVRNLANAVNSNATFMPYPIKGEKGNMLQMHQSLWKSADNNIFYDGGDSYAQISNSGRYYIGGLLEHAPVLCLFTNPTTNSYKRLAVDSKTVGWSRDSKDAIVQVPLTRKNYKEGRYITFALPDPSANAYLAYAAIVAAGLDGIKKKIDPGDPVEKESTSKKKKKTEWKELPGTLYESIEALESDPTFLKGVIPTELLEEYLDIKLKEYSNSKTAISAWEMRHYFNV